MNVNDTGCRPILISVWEDNEYCHVVPTIYGHLYNAHNSHYTVIVISLGTRAVTITWST